MQFSRIRQFSAHNPVTNNDIHNEVFTLLTSQLISALIGLMFSGRTAWTLKATFILAERSAFATPHVIEVNRKMEDRLFETSCLTLRFILALELCRRFVVMSWISRWDAENQTKHGETRRSINFQGCRSFSVKAPEVSASQGRGILESSIWFLLRSVG